MKGKSISTEIMPMEDIGKELFADVGKPSQGLKGRMFFTAMARTLGLVS